MRQFYIILSLLCWVNTAYSQRRPELEGLDRWCVVPRLAYTYQGANFIAPGIGLSHVGAKGYFPIVSGGGFASVDLRMAKYKFVYGPKLGLEATLLFLTGKVTWAFYTNGTETDTRFSPEIGLTFFGYLTCCYGYNYRIGNTTADLVSPHKISVGLNWFFDPWK